MTTATRNDVTALVIGGSTGLGYATARLLVSHGAHVLVTGRTQATLNRAADSLGGHATALRSDSSSPAAVDALADHVRADGRPLDLLFVNAGVTRFAAVTDTTESTYDELFAVNARGVYFTVQRLAPLVRRGGGIVLTTSVANVKGIPMISAYAATKAAVRSMTRSFARELLPAGVRVNAVSPGPVDTGILERAMPADAAAQARAQMTADNPMGRFGDPEEVARAVVYLGLDATFTTGAELAVDGGASQL